MTLIWCVGKNDTPISPDFFNFSMHVLMVRMEIPVSLLSVL